MKMKFILLFGIFTLYYTQVFAGAGGLGIRSNVRIAAGAPVHISERVQLKNYEGLNLKNAIEAKAISSTPITVSLADFNTISNPGNTWLAFNADRSFTMNVGTANTTSPQNWVLPANFEDNFTGAERIDFIDIATIPTPLRIPGANKASVGYYDDEDDRIMKVYAHYNLSSTKIEQLGKSFDLVSGDDDLFDEPDFEMTKVPMALGNNFSTTYDEKDFITNQTLFRYQQNVCALNGEFSS